MEVEELDVVKLKDGRSGTIVYMPNGNAFMFEPRNYSGGADLPIATVDDIEEVIWKVSEHKKM